MIGLDTIIREDRVEPFGLRGMQGYKKAIDTTRYSFDVSRVTPVVGEVRPVNRAVRYLIRSR